MKPMTKRTFGMIALVSMVMVLPVMLYAAELIPFQPHTPIKADEVNQNFVELESRIAPYEDAISVDDLGNVGIGVTTPSQALDVNGKVKATSFVGNGSELTGISGLSQWSNVSGGISYGSGNVGIGTASPLALLHVKNTGSFAAAVRVGDQDTISSDTGIYLRTSGRGYIGTQDAGGITRVTSNSAVGDSGQGISVLSGGNVGIGTATPGSKFVVDAGAIGTATALLGGSSSQYSDIYIGQGTGANQGLVISWDNTNVLGQIFKSGNARNSSISINTTGNVGIGTTSPAYKLEVNGTIHASGGVSVVGAIISDDYLYNSDARLKTDVLPLEHASEGIACLQGVTYRLTSPEASQEPQLGLIAQEVERCFPEVVSTGPDGFKSVSYARLVAPLIENAKEQQQALAAQQREIAWLKAEQAATSSRLARLEALLTPRR